MSAADIQAKAFTDNDVAREAIEALMWPNGPVCPHCGCTGKSARSRASQRVLASTTAAIARASSPSRSEPSLSAPRYRCPNGGSPIHLMASQQEGHERAPASPHDRRHLQTAWFMEHRIREAMRDGELAPMGGAGSIVEADETFIGRKEGEEVRRGYRHKNAILTLVERGGSARSFHVESATTKDIGPIVHDNIARESRLMTDEANYYIRSARGSPRIFGRSLARRIRLDRSSDRDRSSQQYRRGLFLHLQARHDRRLPALRREASCIATLPSLISAIQTAPSSGSMMRSAPPRSLREPKASAWCTADLESALCLTAAAGRSRPLALNFSSSSLGQRPAAMRASGAAFCCSGRILNSALIVRRSLSDTPSRASSLRPVSETP